MKPLLCWLLFCCLLPAADLADLQRSFQRPPDDARIMMRWWWFGSAVTPAGLEREMRLMKEGGIGGFEVQPTYPLALDDQAAGIRNLPFLSPDFLKALTFTSTKARELGLRMDLTLGSGWPFGGPHIPVAHAAARLRLERVKAAGSRSVAVPYSIPGEKLLAVFVAQRRLDLSTIRDGRIGLPSGAEEAWFFFTSRTGQMVKRPAIESEGFVLDHYDRAALDLHIQRAGIPMLRAFGPNPPYSIFCDSLEVYGGDWTGDFLGEFRKRRGYDLLPLLPRMASGADVDAAGIRHDWGRTLTELLQERFVTPLRDWAKQQKTLLRMQTYGIPPATLSMNASVDLPEGEGVQWRSLSSTRWATSAGHLYGRPVISSETWTWLHSPVFRASPLDLKAEADLHFLQGINQLIGHGWPYTPPGIPDPGWRFYAAGVYNEKNPWWIAMPDISLYLQRMSHLLRQGTPANDVAIYLSTSDAWAHFSLGRVNLIETLRERLGPDVAGQVLDAGYGFDFVDDGALDQALSRYKIVVFPGVETIPLETVRKLAQFAQRGGHLVATRRLPERAPGYLATEAEHREVVESARRLLEPNFVADEKTGLGSKLNALLRADVALTPPAPEIGFVHRSVDGAEVYFLANTGNQRRSATAAFRVEGMQAEWWDPLTGRTSAAEIVGRATGTTSVSLDFAPYASRILVFAKDAKALAASPSSASVAPLDVSTGWKVSIGQRQETMDRLRSWTESDETRFYSGTATYEKEISVPDEYFRPGLAVKLDFGEGRPIARSPGMGYQALLDAPVREAAVVYVNDVRAGSVWCPPYSLDVTALLKRGPNRLRIVVANLAINSMAGKALPDYRLLTLRYTERFQAQDMDKVRPQPSGLLGPIRLTAR